MKGPLLTVCAALFLSAVVYAQPGDLSEPGATARVNGVDLYYEIHGRGEPILLLHGGFGSIDHERQLIEGLRERFQVIAVDSRAHGRSSHGEAPMTYPLLAGDMAALMDHLKLERFGVIGFSDGGVIGYILAAKHPRRIKSLVTIGSNFRKEGMGGLTKASQDWIATLTPQVVQGWGDLQKKYMQLNPSPDWTRFVAQVKALWQSDTGLTEDDLKEIQCPVLMAYGQKDSFVELADLVAMSRLVQQCELYIAPGGSHSHHRQMPEVFTLILQRFLGRIYAITED